MGKIISTKTYELTTSAIDEISEELFEFCISRQCDRKIALGFRLNAEQSLIKWLENGDAGNKVTLTFSQRLKSGYVTISSEGRELDPFDDKSGEFGSYGNSFLASINLAPYYIFRDGENRLSFKLPKKSRSQLQVLGIVILVSFAIGLLGRLCLTPQTTDFILVNLINPVYNLFFRILGCIAGPMIFLSVAWGIYGIGDAKTFGQVGKKMMLTYVGGCFLASAASCLMFPFIGPSFGVAESGSAQFSSITELIMGIFPSTIIEPFASGNTLQIIFIAVVVGIAMLFMENRTDTVADLIEQINFIIQFLMNLISKMVPYVVFLVLVNIMWSDEFKMLGSIWILMLVIIAAYFVTITVFTMLTASQLKVSPRKIFSKNLPTFLIALTTASSAAAFGSNITTCEKQLGIRKSITNFGIPLGMVMFKPTTCIYNFALILFFSKQYDIKVSVAWIIAMVIVCSLVSIATPPIPGGGAAAYAVLFAQAGIPSEALGIVLALDVVMDFFITASEMYCLPVTLLRIADRLGMVDKETLKA